MNSESGILKRVYYNTKIRNNGKTNHMETSNFSTKNTKLKEENKVKNENKNVSKANELMGISANRIRVLYKSSDRKINII